MTKLPMKEIIGYKKRMLVMKYTRDREDCDYMWSLWDLALKYILMKALSVQQFVPTANVPMGRFRCVEIFL